jgi:pimeloyl-ACP methyl ester carboxylesterase
MSLVTGILVLFGLWFLARQTLGRLFYVESREDETHWCVTPDGLRLALARYRPKGTPADRPPVVLIPGLSTDRFSFDLEGADGLPQVLQSRGYEVWIIELRGHGRSEGGRKFDPIWSVDDYRQKDLPVAFETIRRVTGQKKFHVIGHSMGGILMYLDLDRWSSTLMSLTTVASSLQYSGTGSKFEPLLKLRSVAARIPTIPIGEFTRLWSVVSGLVPNPLESFNSAAHSIAAPRMRRFHAHGFRAIPVRVLTDHIPFIESLDTTPHAGSLSSIRLPVLAIAGGRDQQCPPEAVRRTAQWVENSKVELFEAYGHLDLLIGDRAATEVHPTILNFLDQSERGG